MGKDKLRRFAAVKQFDNFYEPVIKEAFYLKGNWKKDHFKNDNPIVLELGCGKGEYSVGLAKHFPNKNFIGVDIKGARMYIGAEQALEEKMTNVAFLRTKIDFIDDCFAENEIDEIYSSVAEMNNKELLSLIDYADNNLKILKFLPDNKEIYSKKLDFTYYGYLPILSLRSIPIDEPINLFIKRSFDIFFSLLVIIGILSWLTPLIGFLIKLESKGPVFFKQKRNGLDYKEFYCYKFRSMKPNPEAHLHQIRKGDPRVTRIGKFIRKTSIDELPQFINVLKGDMSVVGPRPHMVSHTHMYAEKIDKFMVRHFIKPGITGLAQVSGFRGEVEDDDFIKNRVKYDIYYLENWSIIMDIRIVIKTVFDALRGDDKAY